MFISSKLSEIWNSSHGQKGADGNDTFLIRECLMSKMGELLAKDRADLIKSLQKRGININPKANDNVLLEVVLDQIRRSEDYATEIVRMMLKKEGISKADGRLVADSSFLLKKIAENGTNAKRIVREYKNQWIYGDDEAKKLYADNSGNDIDKKLIKSKNIRQEFKFKINKKQERQGSQYNKKTRRIYIHGIFYCIAETQYFAVFY